MEEDGAVRSRWPGRAAHPRSGSVGFTLSGMNIKTAMLIPAAASIAIATATVATGWHWPGATAGVTVTVPCASALDEALSLSLSFAGSANPGQHQPAAGGPSSAPVTDPADEPVDPQAPAPAEQGALAQSTGAHTSRFDPYTCASVPASAETSTPSETAHTPQPVPSYEAPLLPFPAGGPEVAAGGPNQSRGPLSEPTTSRTLPPLPPLGRQ